MSGLVLATISDKIPRQRNIAYVNTALAHTPSRKVYTVVEVYDKASADAYNIEDADSVPDLMQKIIRCYAENVLANSATAAVEPTRSERPLFVVFSETLEALHKQPLVFRTKHCVFRVCTRSDYAPDLGTLNDFRIVVNHNTDLPVEYAVEFHDSNINRKGVDEILICNKTRKSFAPMRIPEARSAQDLLARCMRAILNYYGDTGPDRVSRATHAATEPPTYNHIKLVFERLLRIFPTSMDGEGYKHVTPDIVGWREHNTEMCLAVLADRKAPKATLHLYSTAPGYAVEVSIGRLHSDPVLDITSATTPADMLKQALAFYRGHLKSKHVQAAVEPGRNELLTQLKRTWQGTVKDLDVSVHPEPRSAHGPRWIVKVYDSWAERSTIFDLVRANTTYHAYALISFISPSAPRQTIQTFEDISTSAQLLRAVVPAAAQHFRRLVTDRAQAAAEPGSEITGTERGFRGACQLVTSKIKASEDCLRRVVVRTTYGDKRKLDLRVGDSLAVIYDRKNKIPLILEVVYSDEPGAQILRRMFTYNTKTGVVSMGNIDVPGSPDPVRMLRNMLDTYVKHVNLFARAAAEPQDHSIGDDFIKLVRKFERPQPTEVKFKDADFVVTSHIKHGAIDREPQHRTIIVAAKPGTPDSADYCVNLQGYHDEAIRECVAVHSNTRNTSVLVKRFYTSSGPTNLLQQIMAYVHSEEQRHTAL